MSAATLWTEGTPDEVKAVIDSFASRGDLLWVSAPRVPRRPGLIAVDLIVRAPAGAGAAVPPPPIRPNPPPRSEFARRAGWIAAGSVLGVGATLGVWWLIVNALTVLLGVAFILLALGIGRRRGLPRKGRRRR